MPILKDITNRWSDDVLSVHNKAIVVDTSIVIKYEDAFFDRAKSGGVTVFNNTVTRPQSGLVSAINYVARCLSWIERNESHVLLVTDVDHIQKAKKEGKAAIILGPQDTDFIEGNIELLTVFHRMGVRIIQLTYQNRNLVGDGCGERTDSGLSNFGINLVKAMNRLGVIIDLSHCGPKTTMEAIENSKDPIIFSHSNPYVIKQHIRNKTDEAIMLLGEKGGVIGITAYSPICEISEGVRPTLKDFIDHIDYVVNLIGVDHVGIGLDINETSSSEAFNEFRAQYPELCGNYTFKTNKVDGLTSIDLFPNITTELLKRGYGEVEVIKILGGNFLRVFEKVW